MQSTYVPEHDGSGIRNALRVNSIETWGSKIKALFKNKFPLQCAPFFFLPFPPFFPFFFSYKRIDFWVPRILKGNSCESKYII